MISPAPLIIGPTTINVASPVINTVNNGVNKLSKNSGITFLKSFSILAKIYEDAITGNTVP